MKITLDGGKMLTRAAAHDELKEKLHLPDYYGRNLDALWDCISTMDVEIEVENAGQMLDALGPYGRSLLDTLLEKRP